MNSDEQPGPMGFCPLEILDWLTATTSIDEIREAVRAFDAGELDIASTIWQIAGSARRAHIATLHRRWDWFDSRAA